MRAKARAFFFSLSRVTCREKAKGAAASASFLLLLLFFVREYRSREGAVTTDRSSFWCGASTWILDASCLWGGKSEGSRQAEVVQHGGVNRHKYGAPEQLIGDCCDTKHRTATVV